MSLCLLKPSDAQTTIKLDTVCSQDLNCFKLLNKQVGISMKMLVGNARGHTVITFQGMQSCYAFLSISLEPVKQILSSQM